VLITVFHKTLAMDRVVVESGLARVLFLNARKLFNFETSGSFTLQ